jgi:serine/threonine-protein kinase
VAHRRQVPAAPSRLTHLTIALPPDAPIDVRNNTPSLAISPDGSRLVYVAERGNDTQLYVRAMDQSEARVVPGTEGAYGPFFSPDGQWVGFGAGSKFKKVSLTGGTPINICDGNGDGGPSWGQDDTIIFSRLPV